MMNLSRTQLCAISKLRGRILDLILNELPWGNLAEVDRMCLCYSELGEVIRKNA